MHPGAGARARAHGPQRVERSARRTRGHTDRLLKGVFTDCVWVRSTAPLGDDPLIHRAGLAYLSDLGTGFGQQDASLVGRGGPSIDHSIWFPENIRADDWVLVDLRPVKGAGPRSSTALCGTATARSGPPSTRNTSFSRDRRPNW